MAIQTGKNGAQTPDIQGAQQALPTMRSTRLDAWLAGALGHTAWTLAPASSDASFRRYFRVTMQDRPGPANATLIVMDAPPDKEDCRPFVQVARLFADAGVNVPRILAEDFAQGFLLLSDLGNTTYLSALQAGDGTDADRLYRDALTTLIQIQRASTENVLPEYDRALLERELMLFPDWYVAKQRGITLSVPQQESLRTAFERILANNLAQPRVFVHRDYHSRNLMVSTPNPGVLDFQDAVYGPITYDLSSLLRDAYIAWTEEQVIDWCARYWEGARKAGLPVPPDFGDFYRDFEWMGAQRQLKVLGIFARLCHRDGKDAYLKDQPLVMSYLSKTCARYQELWPLARLLDQIDPVDKKSGLTF
jgi:aminoglycoside/choline kinase family phosphotransferase